MLHISLQETKLQEMHTESIETQLQELGLCEHMRVWWNSSRARKGYSGTYFKNMYFSTFLVDFMGMSLNSWCFVQAHV